MMQKLSHVWRKIQSNLFPHLEDCLGPMTKKEKQMVAILEMIRVEDNVRNFERGIGRPNADKKNIARAYVVKAYYNYSETKLLVESLRSNSNLRRICGWERKQDVPSESSFSRYFKEFSETGLVALTHEKLIKKYHSEKVVGHISRDATAIEAREKPLKKIKKEKKKKQKRGRPKTGELRAEKPLPLVVLQRGLKLEDILKTLPTACDVGTKLNSKGYKTSWTGYKLHIDTADTGVAISCVLTSASCHDSQVAIPLMRMTNTKVVNLYQLMDAAYDSKEIKDECIELGHVPIIDSNPRRGEKVPMSPATKIRYSERTQAERTNSRLKDEFGGRTLRVKGHKKVFTHLMFGILVLSADQLLKLLI